jgi:hypothetical protein
MMESGQDGKMQKQGSTTTATGDTKKNMARPYETLISRDSFHFPVTKDARVRITVSAMSMFDVHLA